MKQLEMLHLIARRLLGGKQRADRKTKKVGSGLEFADHREYSPGDDLRNVDWSVLARLDQPLVRLYEQDEDLPVRIVVDSSASMQTRNAEKFRMARRIAAALAYVGLANLDRVGLSLISQSIHETMPAVRGKGRIFQVLDFLRDAPRGGRTALRSACARVAAEASQPGVTIVLSDFYDLEGAFAGLNLLRFRRHEPVCVQVLERTEADPRSSPLRGDVRLVDCEGGRGRDLTLTPALLTAYADAHERFCRQLESECRSRGIPYFRMYADADLHDLMLRIFRFGGVLR